MLDKCTPTVGRKGRPRPNLVRYRITEEAVSEDVSQYVLRRQNCDSKLASPTAGQWEVLGHFDSVVQAQAEADSDRGAEVRASKWTDCATDPCDPI